MEVILLSDHSGEKLVSLNGYLYTQHSTTGQAIIWRCKDRVERNCPARLRTSVQLTNAVSVNSHNHPPSTNETSAIIQLTEEYSNLKRLHEQSEASNLRNNFNEGLSNNYLESGLDQNNELLFTTDALGTDFPYDENEGEPDPADPPFRPPNFSSSSRPRGRGKKRKHEHQKVTGRTFQNKNQNSLENELILQGSKEVVQFSSLSGIFDNEVRIKRKKKPNSIYGPTRKEMPPDPRYVSEISIEGMWATTDLNPPQRFLLYDNHEDNSDKRVILFITDDHLSLLCNAFKVHLESTLPVPPFIFAQLLLIQASLPDANVIVTLGYAFMGSRSEISYVEIFQALKSKARDLGISMSSFQNGVIYMDYEKPAVNALIKVFGTSIKIEGRFFHLSRVVWKKIVDLDLIQCCQISEDFKLFCAQIVCLALLPLADVRKGMSHLKEIAPPNDLKVDLLLDWFESTFVSGAVKAARLPTKDIQPGLNGKMNSGVGTAPETIELHQTPALFPPEKWNISEILITANPRVENQLEGPYHSIKHLIGHNRSAFYRGIKYIRNEHKYVCERLREYEKRTLITRIPRLHLVDAQQTLCRLLISYRESEIDLATFLLSSAKTIRLGSM